MSANPSTVHLFIWYSIYKPPDVGVIEDSDALYAHAKITMSTYLKTASYVSNSLDKIWNITSLLHKWQGDHTLLVQDRVRNITYVAVTQVGRTSHFLVRH